MANNVILNKSLEKYKKKYGKNYKLIKINKNKVEEYNRKYAKEAVKKTYFLSNRKWWLIGDTYYEVPKTLSLGWFKSLNVGIKIGLCVFTAGVVTAAITTPIVMYNLGKYPLIVPSKTNEVKVNSDVIDESGDRIITLETVNKKKKVSSVLVKIDTISLSENLDYDFAMGSQKVTIFKKTLEKNKGHVQIDPAISSILVETIQISGGNSIKTNEKLQLQAIVKPYNAENKNVEWTVTGDATIDQNGLLTAGKNTGTVVVTTTAKDSSGVSESHQIDIQAKNFIVEGEHNVEINSSTSYPLVSKLDDKEVSGVEYKVTSGGDIIKICDDKKSFKVIQGKYGPATISCTYTDAHSNKYTKDFFVEISSFKYLNVIDESNGKKIGPSQTLKDATEGTVDLHIPNRYYVDDKFVDLDSCTGFNNINSIQSVTVNTKSIDSECFSGCAKLKQATITDKVTTDIGNDSFYGCTLLNDIVINSSYVANLNNNNSKLFVENSCIKVEGTIDVSPTSYIAKNYGKKINKEGGYYIYGVRVTKVEITNTTKSVRINGDDLELTASITPSDPTPINPDLKWSVDSDYASIDESSGKPYLHALKKGKVNVTATATDGSGKYHTVEFEVIKPVTSVNITKESTIIPSGKSETLEATVLPTDASEKTLKWSSSDTSIATVNESSGEVTGVTNGTATITATSVDDDTKFDTCSVTVETYVPVTSVSIDEDFSIGIEGTRQLTATVSPEGASYKTVKWSSSDSETVSVDDNGNIKAIKGGIATITATSVDNESISDTCVITVSDFSITEDITGLAKNDDPTVIEISSSITNFINVSTVKWALNAKSGYVTLGTSTASLSTTIAKTTDDKCSGTVSCTFDDINGDSHSLSCSYSGNKEAAVKTTCTKNSIFIDNSDYASFTVKDQDKKDILASCDITQTGTGEVTVDTTNKRIYGEKAGDVVITFTHKTSKNTGTISIAVKDHTLSASYSSKDLIAASAIDAAYIKMDGSEDVTSFCSYTYNPTGYVYYDSWIIQASQNVSEDTPITITASYQTKPGHKISTSYIVNLKKGVITPQKTKVILYCGYSIDAPEINLVGESGDFGIYCNYVYSGPISIQKYGSSSGDIVRIKATEEVTTTQTIDVSAYLSPINEPAVFTVELRPAPTL